MTDALDGEALELGADVLQLLLPHRRPLLMVDEVQAFTRTPRLLVRASRQVSSNEPVFAGHFPGLHLWPGVYTIEGLGQACNVALVLDSLCDLFERHGHDEAALRATLRNAELGFRLQPGFKPELLQPIRAALADPAWTMGFSAHVDVKFLEPVFAGCRLDYRVARTHTVGALDRFEVEALVAGRTVARGAMSAARRSLGPGTWVP
jgi:3-hydroxyacyl-[acyl-carrier-protein] dehydratase